MKLEFEVIPQNPFTNETAEDHPSIKVEEMLRSGIKYAKEGNRAEARRLLQRVTEKEPDNENGWMWLASISEYPEELLVFLQNVLRINPKNERAVDWIKATKSLLAKTFVERGIQASRENLKDFASRCFRQALLHDNQNELAWLSLASNSESPEEKTEYLQKVLSINPENESAIASLQSVKHEVSNQLLKKANFAAISGERETARQLLSEAMQNAPELEEAWILKAYLADDDNEKISCYEKILALNPENEAAQAGLVSLQLLMRKNSESKFFSVEAIEEILENSQIKDVSAAEKKADSFETENSKSQVQPETENLDNIKEIFVADSPENSSLNFISDNHFPTNDPSESPTDELSADFIEEVKSQGGFSDETGAFSLESDDNNKSDFNAFEEKSGEDHIFETFDAAENQDFEQFASVDTDEAIEIEVSNSENLSNIFNPENDEEMSFQDETLLLKVSNKISLEHADSEISILLPDIEELPPVEEFSLSQENFDSYETLSSAPKFSNTEKPDFENLSSSTQKFETAPIQENTAENSICGEEIQTADAENPNQKYSPEDAFACPFCLVTNEPQAFVCSSCRAMLSLSDMEMILSHTEASADVVEMAIEDLEAEKAARELSENELVNLGIAYLNTKSLRKALSCLQSASQMNPNDVVLASKVNFLAIRVSEIEAQESRAEATALRNLTIMVIDDSPTVRKLVAGKLEKCGHTVVSAADGREAMQQLNEVVPDLILLDIMMPEMDGYQVCKLIRNNEPTREVPVVMISGKDGFFDKVRGRMAGTSGFISKPFGPETLMRTIETYVV